MNYPSDPCYCGQVVPARAPEPVTEETQRLSQAVGRARDSLEAAQMARDALKSRLRQERKDGRLISADDIGELKRADLRVKVRLVRPRATRFSASPPRS